MMSDNDSSASGYVTDAFEGINREFTDVASAIGIEKVEDLGNCIVMEYIEGITLKKWLQAVHSRKELKRIAMQLLDAVGYIHSKGSIFRIHIISVF